ncbi:uncharacterized protein LOC134533510 [Bacillus rossius redtenbacheri]|uniref:uncharacterized protein LOC134533510 n=1 Tax=Bacillus rossius redtenbacheri TaxID=93214 RepID=UPI002FDECD2E
MAERSRSRVAVNARGTFAEDPAFQQVRELTAGAHTLTEASFSAGPGGCSSDSGADRTLASFKVYQLHTAPFVMVMCHKGSATAPQDAVSVRDNLVLVRTSADAECSFEFPRALAPDDVKCELSSDGYLVVTVPQEMVATRFDYHNGWAH